MFRLPIAKVIALRVGRALVGDVCVILNSLVGTATMALQMVGREFEFHAQVIGHQVQDHCPCAGCTKQRAERDAKTPERKVEPIKKAN